MHVNLQAPCSYQGGKQRVAVDIVSHILSEVPASTGTVYDLCCGSGVVSLEFMNRGISPSDIVMCDIGPWGEFWKSIGDGTFDVALFKSYCAAVPRDLSRVKDFLTELSCMPVQDDTVYRFLLMQAGAFGGKPVWHRDGVWRVPGFRSYWMPTATSVRRSPMNPLQPMADELYRRVSVLAEHCLGVKAYIADIFDMLPVVDSDSDARLVYIDPPYDGVTGYGFDFDLMGFVGRLSLAVSIPIYVSEGRALASNAIRVHSSHKGGITANRAVQHQEWLSRF